MKKLLLACCMVLSAAAVGAPRAENGASKLWWTYLAEYKGVPGSVLVDMGLFNSARRRSFPYLITAGTSYSGDDKRLLPTPDEGTRLQALSNRVLAAMAAHGKIIHAGTFTHKREYVLYVYAEKPDGYETVFRKVMKEHCPDCEVIFNVRPDQPWDVYRDFLYPNAATLRFYDYRSPEEKPGTQ